jgi:hypothetical protein
LAWRFNVKDVNTGLPNQNKIIKKCKGLFALYRSFLRPIVIVCGLIGLAAYAAIMLRGPQGLSALDEKRRAVRELEEQNANLLKQIADQKKLIEKLQKDPSTQERFVRQRTGKTRPGDTSFVLSDQPKP